MSTFGSPTSSSSSVSTRPASIAPTDCNVPQAGNDGISSLNWSPTANYLVSSNWDSAVRCWEVQMNPANTQQIIAQPKAQINHENNSPVLDTCFSTDGSTVFSGGADKAVRMWQLGQQAPSGGIAQQIGVHDAPVKSVGFLQASNLIVSGGWDAKLKFWDTRSPQPVGEIPLRDRIYDLDVRGNLMVVATAGRHVYIYDVSGSQPRQHSEKESPLKYQSRCVSCFPDQTGFAIGSIEGRVGIQYVQKVGNKDHFAFKCHRQDTNVYSVNYIAFQNQYGTFATVGSDGIVTFWDKDNKQRLKAFNAIRQTIPCAAFNFQGNLFAYASSYDWSKGSGYYTPGGGTTPNEIYIHYTPEDEIKPKATRKK